MRDDLKNYLNSQMIINEKKKEEKYTNVFGEEVDMDDDEFDVKELKYTKIKHASDDDFENGSTSGFGWNE